MLDKIGGLLKTIILIATLISVKSTLLNVKLEIEILFSFLSWRKKSEVVNVKGFAVRYM